MEMTFCGQIDIILGVKNKFKHLWYQVWFDRVIILLGTVLLVTILASEGLVKAISIDIVISLAVILFIRLLIYYRLRSSNEANLDCNRDNEAMNIIAELASNMNVKIHPTKSLEIVPAFVGAKSIPLFFEGFKIHFTGRVSIGRAIICGLDNVALKGIFAHELAHLKKRHSLKSLAFLLPFSALLIYLAVFYYVVPFFITLSIGIFILSLISWHDEYEADAVAAEYVDIKVMVGALEQISKLIYRPGDTLTHPSFKKRISRVRALKWEVTS